MSVFEKTVLPNGLRVVTAPMPQAKSVACFLMMAAGSRYETRDSSGIAHFAEHMFFKGTERRPTARDISSEIDAIGGEFNAFTGKEYTGYFVKCAAEHRDIALDVLVDMIRHSKFDPEEIEREKGVIVEEMNMYYDTPRDYVGRRLRPAPVRRPPARVGHHRHEGDRARGDARDVPRVPRPLVPRAAHGRRGRRRRRRRRGRADRLAARRRPERRASGARGGRGLPVGPARQAPHEDVRPGPPLPRRARATRSTIPTATRSGSSRPCSAAGCRRASSPRCASGAGSPTTSTATTRRYTDTGTLFAQAGVDINRIDEAVSTIAGSSRGIADEPVPAKELEKARNFAKGRFVLSLEDPKGMIMFGLRREVLGGRMREPDEILAGFDTVTVEDIQRVAQDLIRDEVPQPRGHRPVRRPRAFLEAARAVGVGARPAGPARRYGARSYG